MPAADYRAYPVLCVDDEESNLVLMQYALESQFDVTTTGDPAEAAKLLSTRRFDVLLTDQRMPGMTGVELCAHARVVAPDTARIIITGYADLHATIDAVNRGAVMRYLEKPMRDGDLAEVVRSAINVIHAKRAIAALEHQMIQGGTEQAFRAIERRIARELRGPVGELKGTTSHLQDLSVALADQEADPRLVSEMEQTLTEVDSQVRVLDTLARTLERSAAPEPRHTDVHRVIRSILTLAGQAPGVDRPPLEIMLDPSILAQALGAAYRRALKVALDPNSVTLDCTQLTTEVPGQVAVSCKITDNGPMLAEEDLAALFDARLNPLPGDDGRSMALAAELVRDVGGQASARSDGERTVVEFQFFVGGYE